MKKLIGVFCILLSFLTFKTSYDGFNEIQFFAAGSLQYNELTTYTDMYIISVETSGSSTFERDEITDTFKAWSNGKDVMLMLMDMEYKPYQLYNRWRHFIFTSTFDLTEFLPLRNQQALNFANDTETRFYSSDKDDNLRGDTLLFFDDKYYVNVDRIIEYRPFHQAKEYIDNELQNLGIIVFSPKEKTKEYKQELKNLFDYKIIIEDYENMYEGYYSKYNGENLKLIALSFVILLMLLTSYLGSKKKDIAVRKLHGIPDSKILFKLFWSLFLSCIGLYLTTQVLCFVVMVGMIHDVSMELTKILMVNFGMFFGMLLLVMIVIFFYSRVISIGRNLKGISINQSLIQLNYVIKLFVILSLTTPILSMYNGIQDNISKYSIFKKHEIEMTNMALLARFNVTGASGYMDNIRIYQKAFRLLDEKGAIYVNFKEFDNAQRQVPMIHVNANYLKKYSIYTSDNDQLVNLDGEIQNVLVPSKYYDVIDKEEYCLQKICNYIEVRDGNNYFNNTSLFFNYGILYYTDPVIVVANQFDKELTIVAPNIMYPVNDYDTATEEIQEILAPMGYDDKITVMTVEKLWDRHLNQIWLEMRTLFIQLLVYAILVLAFLYQNIYLYFDEYTKRQAIKYISGYIFIERYQDLLMYNSLLYLIPLFVLPLFKEVSLIQMFVLITWLVGFELGSIYFLIRNYERKSVASVLKGEK